MAIGRGSNCAPDSRSRAERARFLVPVTPAAAAGALWCRALAGGGESTGRGQACRRPDCVRALLLLLAPIFIFAHANAAKKSHRLVRSPRLGRWGVVFDKYNFRTGPFSGLPVLLNVWKGDMSFVGPRPIAPGSGAGFENIAARRFAVRPGIFCLWWIRMRANTAYGSEALADAEYVDTRSFLGDLGIALRAVPASLNENGTAVKPPVVNLLGIPINNLTMDEATAKRAARQEREKGGCVQADEGVHKRAQTASFCARRICLKGNEIGSQIGQTVPQSFMFHYKTKLSSGCHRGEKKWK